MADKKTIKQVIKNWEEYDVGGGTILPPVINDKYLHTNADTWDFEWVDVVSGNTFIATYWTTTMADILTEICKGKNVLVREEIGNDVFYYKLDDKNSTLSTINFSRNDWNKLYTVAVSWTNTYTKTEVEFWWDQWVGTQAEYDAITTKEEGKLYFIY